MTFLLAASMLLSTQSPAYEGRYEGVLHLPSQDQRFIVDLGHDAAGTAAGSITMPGLYAKGAPVEKFSNADGKLSFEVSSALGGFQVEGAIHNDQLDGTFKQGGNSTELHLFKTGPAQVDLPPSPSLIADDAIGVWKGDYTFNYVRHVTLTLSNENGVPKALLVIVGKRTNNAPVDYINDTGGYLTLRASTFGITIEGAHRAGSDICKAYVSFAGLDFPLILHKSKEGK